MKIQIKAICLVLFFQIVCISIASAEICPDCPSGCIALGQVKTVEPAGVIGDCPEGCIPYSSVEALADEWRCEKGEVTSLGPYKEIQQATRERNIFVHTAMGQKKGRWLATGYVAAIWEFAYGMTDNLQLGGTTILPIGGIAVFPKIKGHGALIDDRLYLSGAIAGGITQSFTDGQDFGWIGMSELLLSAVAGEHTFTFGLTAITGGSENSIMPGVVMFPQAAYRVGFNPKWSFQMELIPIAAIGSNASQAPSDQFWVFAYGFRAHGKLVYGDFGFFIPFFKDFVKYAWRYVPLGFPHFTLGFIF